MHRLILPALLVGLIGIPARADDAEARKVVDAAIKAVGGDGKKMAVTWKGKGKFYGDGAAQDYTGIWYIHSPDKFRMDIENVFSIVVNGDKGWISAGGNAMEMTKEQLAEQREEMHANWVASLYPLKDKAFTLALIGESKLDDKPVVGVKVSSKGKRDVSLYFDKESHLLVKSEHVVKDQQVGNEVTQESVVNDWAKVGDRKVAGKMTTKRDGKLYVEGEMSDYKVADKHPDGTFDKP